MKKVIITAVTVAVIAALGYSLFVTFRSGANEKGIISCPSEENCIWTAHIHAYIPIELCGEDYRLPIEVGPLTGPHTHEEKNVAHWHDQLPYAVTTKLITDTKPLTLGAFFDAISVPFGTGLIGEYRDGNLCSNQKSGSLKVFINGEIASDYRDYIWQNRDVIQIFFDERSAEQTRLFVEEHPVSFPALGRG